MHVALELFGREAVQLLLVRHRTEGRDGQRLGLAACEQPRAVRSWQDSNLDGDRPHILEAAAVDAHALLDHALPDAILHRLVEALAYHVAVPGAPFAELVHCPRAK